MEKYKKDKKSTGIIRYVDSLGRIVVPKEIRAMFKIVEKEKIKIYVKNNVILLEKFEPNCILCGNKEDLMEFKEKLICKKCVNNIEKL
ncbi:MAG: AbrB/MazE/SpoVT family DNA-binding domain-containing protein [Clostridia bacterium]|nr:AbrB/MazE/SpoVT family DNA-binding domain-containing protein [Clostridia bacterium]